MATIPRSKLLSEINKVCVLSKSSPALSTAAEATLDVKPFKFHKIEAELPSQVTVSRDEAMKYYEQMQKIRRMETNLSNLYKERKVRGFCHLYSGQEAIAVGMHAGLHENDAVITAYRCHGWTLTMGVPVQDIFAELMGRVGGNVYGKGGSMHLYCKNFFGGNGIVGAQTPLGAGIALSMQYRNDPNICATLYGDGAANQGQLYEALNMAALWKLPCLFVCENNGYGMGTAVDRASASTEYYTRGDYVPGIWVDAMDVLSVKTATEWAANECRNGRGPLMVEMATYRYHGHSMSDPGTSYRTREEIQQVRKTRDPITGFKDIILNAGLVTEDELKAVDKSVRKYVDDAQMAAERDVEPPEGVLLRDIYCDTPGNVVRGTTVDQQYVPDPATTEEYLKHSGIPCPRTTISHR